MTKVTVNNNINYSGGTVGFHMTSFQVTITLITVDNNINNKSALSSNSNNNGRFSNN